LKEIIAGVAEKALIETARLNGTDPVANKKYLEDGMRETLRVVGLPYTLATLKAMSEGICYYLAAEAEAQKGVKMSVEIALGVLVMFEDKLQKEADAKLEKINFGDKKNES